MTNKGIQKVEYDGSLGWLVVFVAFMTHFITHGIVYSYGILFLAFEDVFGANKAEISWIASFTTGSLYLSGPLASSFLRRHGSRAVACTGSILSFTGCILTLFAPNLYFIYFSLGFLTGVGYGLIFLPAVVEVTMHFKKHRALACGIAVSGAGAGAFVFSPLIEHLLEAYAWRGTLLICSGLLLNCVPCSLIFRNHFIVPISSKQENDKSNDYVGVKVEYVHSNTCDTNKSKTSCNQCDETDIQIATKTQITEINKEENVVIDNKLDMDTELPEESVKEKMLQDVGKEAKNYSRCFCSEKPKFSLFHILQQREMLLFYCAQILFFFGFYFPFIGIPGMAIQSGIGGSKGVWIISSIGISTVVGRIVLGYLSDRSFMNSLILYKVALLVAGVSTSLVSFFSSFPALLLYALAFGLSTAVLLSQTTVVLIEIIGMERMSDAMGLNNMFSGFGALLGPPALGMLYDQTKNYSVPFITSGLSMAIGGILLFLMALCSK